MRGKQFGGQGHPQFRLGVEQPCYSLEDSFASPSESQRVRSMSDRLVASNKRARHDYEISESYEAGLVLTGTEVKSLRSGQANLKGSYARVEGEELWLYDCHIPPYKQGGLANHEPRRPRKLLMNRSEIRRLIGKVAQKGVTLIPLRIYFQGSWAKVEIAVARAKQKGDKRRRLAEEVDRREMQQATQRHRE